MFLTEYECKKILKERGITIPRGSVADNSVAVMHAAAALNRPVALKALVASGGRAKMGGVVFADTPVEASKISERLFDMKLAGQIVNAVLVEEKISPVMELYLGITIDLAEGRPLVIFSMGGGVDIEEAESAIFKCYLDLFKPVEYPFLLDLIGETDLPVEYSGKLAGILSSLIDVFFDHDALMVEINPLMLTADKEVVAADAKIVIDDSARFRQKKLLWDKPASQQSSLEREAEEAGLSLVLLDDDGDIGLICGGAGLGMATVDTVAYYGGRAANFLDSGGGLSVEKMATALEIVLKIPGIKGVLVNVFGGINNCLNIAGGIAQVIENQGNDAFQLPIVVKMQGHFQEEGWALLDQHTRVTVIRKGYIDHAVIKILTLIEAENI